MFFDSQECAWTDMQVFLNGKMITKISGIKYKKSVEKEPIYGAGDEPLSIQRGQKKYTGELKLKKGSIDDINRAAKQVGFADALDMFGLIIVVNYKPTLNRPMQQDTLIGTEFIEFEKGWESNAKEMPVTVPFVFLSLKSVE